MAAPTLPNSFAALLCCVASFMDTFCPTVIHSPFSVMWLLRRDPPPPHPWCICLIQINVPSTEFFNRPGRRKSAIGGHGDAGRSG